MYLMQRLDSNWLLESCDIRMIETLICVESSHWLNLDNIIAQSRGQMLQQVLVMSVNASIASTQGAF